MILVKRIYDETTSEDGIRILVDRLWPRGLSKENAEIDHWFKSLAPSNTLRKWFQHDPKKWNEFLKRYHKELDELEGDGQKQLQQLITLAKQDRVTLLFAAKDQRHNNAIALKLYLEHRLR